MSASKIDSEIIKYFMGKTIDIYEDVQSLGTLRRSKKPLRKATKGANVNKTRYR
jgi:hypothetical protein